MVVTLSVLVIDNPTGCGAQAGSTTRSMSTNTPSGDKSPVTTEQLRRRRQTVPTVEYPHELRCEICNARCTRAPDGVEYGHRYGCPERPKSLPQGAGSGKSWYHDGESL